MQQNTSYTLNSLIEKETCFNELFAYIDGYEVNRQATADYKIQNPSSQDTIYGEATFQTIFDIFSHPALASECNNARIFYDLGSGIGNVAIASAILGYFQQIHGIELMEKTHNTSVFLKNTLASLFPEIANKITFYNQNFLDHNFSNADIVFANHPVRLEYIDILQNLEDKFQQLKKGAIVIYTIRSLENKQNFETILNQQFQFGWGKGTIFAYRKIA